MKIALIADIHGNAVAFDAVLNALLDEPLDAIVCLGDVAATGPEPARCLDKLKSLECPVIMGNTDTYLLDPVEPTSDDPVGRAVEEIDAWCAAQLNESHRDYIRSFRPVIDIDCDGIALRCYHGSPRANTDRILPTAPDAELDGYLDGDEPIVMAGGHTHEPMLRRHGRALFINPGSVGLPHEQLDRADFRNPLWAEYGVLTVDKGSVAFELRRAPLERERVVQAARDSGMPHADLWTADWS